MSNADRNPFNPIASFIEFAVDGVRSLSNLPGGRAIANISHENTQLAIKAIDKELEKAYYGPPSYSHNQYIQSLMDEKSRLQNTLNH